MFQVSGAWIMVIRDNGDVEFESDILDCENILPLKDCTED